MNIKRTGFTRPFHRYQILSWIITFEHIVIGIFIILPLLPLADAIIFAMLFAISQIILIFVSYKIMKSDPTDRIVYQ